jgi:large subunit ribosomal protein L9
MLAKIFLLKSLGRLGQAGDIISVKSGYAVNYLIPNKVAVFATKETIEEHSKNIDSIKANDLSLKEKAEKDKINLFGKYVIITSRVSDEGILYGSVTNKNIAEAVKAEFNIDLEPNQVTLNEKIKSSGIYTAIINLYSDINVKINVAIDSTVEIAQRLIDAETGVDKKEDDAVQKTELVDNKPVEDNQ